MKKGFTLAEVMIALIVATVVMAASAPIITKKSVRTTSGMANNPWEWVGDSANAKFNAAGGSAVAMIGTGTLPEGTYPKLLINTDGLDTNHIDFYKNGEKQGGMSVTTRGVLIGEYPSLDMTDGPRPGHRINVVGIGNVVDYGNRAIAIGANVTASGTASIGIGQNIVASGSCSVAVGNGANAEGYRAIAIGESAKALAANTAAIGAGTSANRNCYVFGRDTHVDGANAENCIVIGHGLEIDSDHDKWSWYQNELSSSYSKDLSDMVVIKGPALMVGDGYVSNHLSAGVITTNKIIYKNVDHTTSSDLRLKNLGNEYTSGIDKLNKLKIYNYTFKSDPKTKKVGVIAQDLMKVFPDAVSKGPDGYYCIRQEDMFYAMINALKDFDKRIKKITANIANLNKDFASIDAKVNNLSIQTKKNSEDIKLMKKELSALELKLSSVKGKN